jgi:hypothetical protein
MRIAYFTTDEVNQALALQFVKTIGVTLWPWPLLGPLPDGEVDAVVYDLDHLPEPRRTEILAKLTQAAPRYPTAVHSYNLNDDQIQALQDNGVSVYRHLELRAIRRIQHALTHQAEWAPNIPLVHPNPLFTRPS